MTHQKTITVEHPDAHEATVEQINAALKAALKEDGVKSYDVGSIRFNSGTSGQSSSYTVSYDEGSAKKAAPAKKAEPKDDSPEIVTTTDATEKV